MTDNRTTELKRCIKCIDDMTDDLLEIADALEEHQINVKLDNGRYLNPVSAIRSKVDVIWDETQAIAATLGRGECELWWIWSDPEDGDCFECSLCNGAVFSFGTEPRFCSMCGAHVTKIDYGKVSN